MGLLAGGAALAALPAHELDTNEARALIQQSLNEVYAVINSGQPPAQTYATLFLFFALPMAVGVTLYLLTPEAPQ